MKLEIYNAIPLILAIPAHRSKNEGHRVLGEGALGLLFSYKEDTSEIEERYNTAMISSVLSAARAFSVERDRIESEWKAIDSIKLRKENFIEIFNNLSPFTKNNYWSKILAIIIAAGFTTNIIITNYQNTSYFVYYLLGFLILFEAISKVGSFLVSKYFESQLPKDKSKKWQQESMPKYKHIIGNFIEDAIEIHKTYYPDEKELCGYNIINKEAIDQFKDYLINIHFYL